MSAGSGVSPTFTAPASHDLASIVMTPAASTTYVPSPTIWLESSRGKGLEIAGTFSVSPSTNQPQMELTFTNNALSPMTGFAIQFNKNSFGLAPAQPLNVPSPLQPKQSAKVMLPLGFGNQVVKVDPLMNLQVGVQIFPTFPKPLGSILAQCSSILTHQSAARSRSCAYLVSADLVIICSFHYQNNILMRFL